MNAKKITIRTIAKTVFGAANDAVLWDGWRSYGDAWATAYLRAQILRGVDRAGPVAQIHMVDDALRIDMETK